MSEESRMSRMPPVILFAALLLEGSVVATPVSTESARNGGILESSASDSRSADTGLGDGGSSLPSQSPLSDGDGGTPKASTTVSEGILWPDDLRPLAALDGPSVLAAHAALQRVLTRVPKEYAETCAYSARAMELIVSQEGVLYFVRINRRPEKCGHVAPGTAVLDWFEMYAVSSDGQVLARYPYFP